MDWMKQWRRTGWIAGLVLWCCAHMAIAQEEESRRITSAAEVVEELAKVPEGIPPDMIRSAKGIVIIPNVIKGGFIVGGRFGRGVVLVRQKGLFSPPVFVTMGGGSVGFQAGVQGMDLVLVFRTQQSLDNLLKGKLTLGADANVAAGPVGRHGEAATDLSLKAEVYSYSKTRGLFAGVSLEGSWIAIDHEANAAYYGQNRSTSDILHGRGIAQTPAILRLHTALDRASQR
jgi:lipid-binding SYLF domain-containing protein